MITTFRARNYGCLVDVSASLRPLHAFIGPNDSGKSTLLRGLRTLVQLAGSAFEQGPDGAWKPFDPLLPDVLGSQGNNGARLRDLLLGGDVDGGSYELRTAPHRFEEAVRGEDLSSPYTWQERDIFVEPTGDYGPFRPILQKLGTARLLRLDPDALRAPSGLIPEASPVGFLDDRGFGLPGVYFALRNRDDASFSTANADVRRHFPNIKSIRVRAVTSGTVALEAELEDGTRIDTPRMSEGLLYYLAFAALRHLDPVSLLLVEEPENGLHPARIAEVVRILRAITEATSTQVVMATHSPLVVNELRPDEVTVVTRPSLAEGTKLTLIADTPDFEERSRVDALGELWISYSDGKNEGPLLEGREP